MKKLASLFALSALALFAVGCNEADMQDGPEPIPADTGTADDGMSSEGGSGLVDEGGAVDEAPPVTDEAPPTLTPTPESSDAATEEPATEEPATEEPAAEATDAADPAPATEEPAPQ